MSNSTANKLVAFFALGGVAFALWTGKDSAARYRKVWGVTLLSLGGAALADFAPAIVGPFFALVIIASIAGHQTELGQVFSGIKTRAGVNSK